MLSSLPESERFIVECHRDFMELFIVDRVINIAINISLVVLIRFAWFWWKASSWKLHRKSTVNADLIRNYIRLIDSRFKLLFD